MSGVSGICTRFEAQLGKDKRLAEAVGTAMSRIKTRHICSRKGGK